MAALFVAVSIEYNRREQEASQTLSVMAGLVPAIHAFLKERRGCPAQGRA
jgi:hypothetical protein